MIMKKVLSFFSIISVCYLLCPALFGGFLFEKAEYAARRRNLMGLIPNGVGIIVGAQQQAGYYPYYQNNDLMYFSGVEIPNAILLVDGIRKESVLFFTITEEKARSEGISLDLVRKPRDVTGIEKALPLGDFSSYLLSLAAQTKIFYASYMPEELMREVSTSKFRVLFNEMMQNPWDGRLTRELQFVKYLRERFPRVEVKDLSEQIWSLRVIKSPAEIELMRKVAQIGAKAHIELMKATRVGMHEYELAALYEYFCKKEGCDDLAFYTIISSGENHAFRDYHKHDRTLKDGDFLVVDVGPDYGYYDVDITVSFPANGKFSPRQREIYEAVNAVHQATMSVYRPGLTLEDVREQVKRILKKKGFDPARDIFKDEPMHGRFGHYVGMSVHDVGGRPLFLKAGMVIANEPHIELPDENIGVRIEDTILITRDGCENLTAGVPREIVDIEALMKKEGAIEVLKKAGLY